MSESLLPMNAAPVELALEATVARLDATPVPLDALWDPARCPVALLPWLAWALGVDWWEPGWSPEVQRAVIAASIDVHRHRGTPAAMKRALMIEGYGDADLIEDKDLARIGSLGFFIGGAAPLGRTWLIGPSDPHWADYWVDLKAAIPRSLAQNIVARLQQVAPARCRLRAVTLTGVVYLIGDGLWLIGDDVAIGNVYLYEVP